LRLLVNVHGAMEVVRLCRPDRIPLSISGKAIPAFQLRMLLRAAVLALPRQDPVQEHVVVRREDAAQRRALAADEMLEEVSAAKALLLWDA